MLNELGLVFSPYNMPKPTCIAKLKASTQYYCPEVCCRRTLCMSVGVGTPWTITCSPGQSGVSFIRLGRPHRAKNSSFPLLDQVQEIPANLKRGERVIFLKDVDNLRCVKAVVTRPLWVPPRETIEAIFPSTAHLLQASLATHCKQNSPMREKVPFHFAVFSALLENEQMGRTPHPGAAKIAGRAPAGTEVSRTQ